MIIYKAQSKTTGKIYVGQTIRPLNIRKSEHVRSAANITKVAYPTPFQRAMSLEGSGNFEWEILEICADSAHMNEREKFYIKLLDTLDPKGLNSTSGGYMGADMSEDIRRRIGEGMTKVHQDPAYQARVYPKLKGHAPPNKGVPMSDTQKIKVSAAKKAIYADPEYINPNIGQKRTGATLSNVRDGHKRRKMPKGDAWSAAHAGQYTEEVRLKMRATKLGKKPTNTKQILCIETGQIFNGLTETAQMLGINRQSIYLQIQGKLKKVGGKYTFKYVE